MTLTATQRRYRRNYDEALAALATCDAACKEVAESLGEGYRDEDRFLALRDEWNLRRKTLKARALPIGEDPEAGIADTWMSRTRSYELTPLEKSWIEFLRGPIAANF